MTIDGDASNIMRDEPRPHHRQQQCQMSQLQKQQNISRIPNNAASKSCDRGGSMGLVISSVLTHWGVRLAAMFS
jgi:hypothetical protein